MEQKKIKEKFNVNNCEISAVVDGSRNVLFDCKAVVETTEVSRTFHTKKGIEYTAKKKVYSIIVCKQPSHSLSFEKLEKIERYDIKVSIAGKYSETPYIIEDAAPKTIDLNGDWVFNLSEDEGKELYELYLSSKQNVTGYLK